MTTTTYKNYLKDSSTSGMARIVEVVPGEKPVVRLAETWFHPQGGGQKADRGRIGSSQVIHVAHNGGIVDHFVDTIEDLPIGHEVVFEIDVPWRRINAVYHTAGHLVAGVVESLYPGWSALSGHQWPGEARVEFASHAVANGAAFDLKVVEGTLREALAHGLEVQVVGDPFHSREIAIGCYKGIPCGGTHVECLAEIADIRIIGIKKKGDRFRVSYEAIPA